MTTFDILVGGTIGAVFVWVAFGFPGFKLPEFNLDFTQTIPKESDMRASIVPLSNGRFGLATSEGIVGSYSRARDARRGANRLGFVVV